MGDSPRRLGAVSENEKINILNNVLGLSYRESQNQLLFHCPKCDHHKKKLSINIDKNVFKCWICGFSGRNLYRLIKTYGIYADKKNWSRLTQQVEIESFSEKLFGVVESSPDVLHLPEEFLSLANKSLPATSIYPINYLKSRGLVKRDIIRWKIGYCSSGKYEGRVIFPSFDKHGKLNYFVARSYTNNWKRYCNPPNKNDIIFNHLNLNFLKPLTLVEGVFDAVKAGSNTVPLLGSTLVENSALLSEIVKHDTTVYLALDSDASRKTENLIELFFKYDIEVCFVDLRKTKHDDVGDMSNEEFKQLKASSKKITIDDYITSKIMNI